MCKTVHQFSIQYVTSIFIKSKNRQTRKYLFWHMTGGWSDSKWSDSQLQKNTSSQLNPPTSRRPGKSLTSGTTTTNILLRVKGTDSGQYHSRDLTSGSAQKLISLDFILPCLPQSIIKLHRFFPEKLSAFPSYSMWTLHRLTSSKRATSGKEKNYSSEKRMRCEVDRQ